MSKKGLHEWVVESARMEAWIDEKDTERAFLTVSSSEMRSSSRTQCLLRRLWRRL
jgi:hypothetical protein